MHTAIQFNKYHVVNKNNGAKARVYYSACDNYGVRGEKGKVVVLYAKGPGLGRVFGEEYQNNTDIMIDYFDAGKVVLPASHPLYAAALARAIRA